MPVYEYRCTKCDEVAEFDLPLGSLDDQVCPSCGSVAKRIFQVFKEAPKIGGGACSTEGSGEGDSCSCVDGMMESLSSL